ncbi:MAG: hypothetical protein JSU05_06270, partial [Bacteroidetes bacterium]|nr:hypothetical protein [Bacteroidota bacterium]
YNDSTKNISVEGLRWQNGNVNLAALPQPSKSSHTSLVLKNIQGNHTSVSIKNKTGLITTNVTSVSLDELIKLPGARSQLRGLELSGENLDIIYPDSWIESQHYFFNDHSNSVLLNSRYQKSSESNSIVVTSPAIRFVPDVEEILNGHFRFDKMNIDTPFIHINIKKPVSDSAFKVNLPDLSVKQLIINQPKFLFEKNNSKGLNKIQWANTVSQSSTNQWQAQNLVITNTNSTITADELSMQTDKMLFSSGKKQWGVDSGLVQVDAKKLEANIAQSGKFKWSLLVESAALNNPLPLSIGKNQATLLLDDVSAGNMQLTNENIKSLNQLISHNTGLQFSNKKGKLLDGKNIFQWNNAILDPTAKNLVADSFSYSPVADKDSFIAAHPFQTDYITAKTGRITLQNINLANYINDSTLNASLLSVTNPVIDVYRDKRKPFNKGQVKLLPTALLKRIPERINIDTINLDDATINYTELNDKTNKAGTLLFNHTNAQLLHTRSYDIADTDSLRLFANSKFLDKIPVTLIIEESYSDSLSRFRMQASIEKADMKTLNPVLIPLASVKLKSGYLDTLNMNVIADDSLGYGEMNIRYHQLKIQVLVKGDENKKTLRNRLLNFIANTFVVKKNNRGRTGIIYYLRNRDRSIFNYMAKMLLNGVSTSSGFKKEKRKQHRMHQQLIRKNLYGS